MKYNINPKKIREVFYNKSQIYGDYWIDIFNHKHNVADKYNQLLFARLTSDSYIRYQIRRTIVNLFVELI